MTTSLPQGELTIERMCALVGVSRAGYYRAWAVSAEVRRGMSVLASVGSSAMNDWLAMCRWRPIVASATGCCGGRHHSPRGYGP